MYLPKNFNGVPFQPLPIVVPDLHDDLLDNNFPLYTADYSPITTQFLLDMRTFIHDPTTMEIYRCNPKNFTRDRCFTFPRLAVAILKEHARPAQTRINHLFQNGGFGDSLRCPTASAFYQARSKLQPAFFQAWASRAVQFFYTYFPQESLVDTWNDHFLWAIDCSTFVIPDTLETRKHFSIKSNQYPGKEAVLAQASIVYDVLNEIPVHTYFGKIQAGKNVLINEHARYLNQDVIAIYDRGYADYDVIAFHMANGSNFVIRFPLTSTYKVVPEFVKSSATDEIVTLHVPKGKKSLMMKRGWPVQVQVRLVKIVLETGDIEVLMTSLLDQERFPEIEFQWLYSKRWGVETAFLRFKHQLEVECFSSGKVFNIEQDFHAAVIFHVIESILDKAQNHAMQSKNRGRTLRHEYKVNKAGAYTLLSDHLAGLFLLDKEAFVSHLVAFQQDIHLYKSSVRPGRHKARPKMNDHRRLKYHLYQKKRR